MPTRRFDSLEPDRKKHLLDAAAAEFAAHGFEAASFNRIIERAGTSKGSLYYYFEDKADLYATVIRDAIQRLMVACGALQPFETADGFWLEIEHMCARGIRYYRSDPHIAGLVRSLVRDGFASGPIEEIRAASAQWSGGLLAAGQAVGAIRTDLPADLMLAIGASVSEGFDIWLAEKFAGGEAALDDAAIEHLAATMADLYRRMALPARTERT